MVSGVMNVGKFFLTGSFDRGFENKLNEASSEGSFFKVEKFIKTYFNRDSGSLKDHVQLLATAKDENRTLITTKPSATSADPFSCTVDDQVIFSFPNLPYYKGIYDQLYRYARVGMWTAGAAAAGCAIRIIFTRTIAAIPFTGAAMLAIGALYFYRLGVNARSFSDKIFISKNGVETDILKYAGRVQEARDMLLTNKSVKKKTRLLPAYQAASLTEREIGKLFNMLKESQLQTSESSDYQPICSLLDVLGDDYKIAGMALTPEMQAIKAYLVELTGSEWIQKTIPALKEIITQSKRTNKTACAARLESILLEYSTMKCLLKLDLEAEKTVVGHLNTYLEARYKGDDAALPAKEALVELAKPIKKLVRQEMVAAVTKYKFSLEKISQDNPSWELHFRMG